VRPRRRLLLSLALAGCASESAPQGVDSITGVFRSGEADIAYALDVPRRARPASGGVYREVGTSNSEEMFQLLASDAARAIDLLAARQGIDTTRLGLAGVSQAG
jgi:hypothetical protein